MCRVDKHDRSGYNKHIYESDGIRRCCSHCAQQQASTAPVSASVGSPTERLTTKELPLIGKPAGHRCENGLPMANPELHG